MTPLREDTLFDRPVVVHSVDRARFADPFSAHTI